MGLGLRMARMVDLERAVLRTSYGH